METPDDDRIQPTVRDALIGALIGIVLIYLGWRVPYRIVSWSGIGLGVLFLLVMTGFIVVDVWQRASPRVHRQLARWRGHVRRDPQLGALTRNVHGGYWQSTVSRGGHLIEVVVEGGDEPVDALVREARILVDDFQGFNERVGA